MVLSMQADCARRPITKTPLTALHIYLFPERLFPALSRTAAEETHNR